jgi:hypothetical protein
MCNSTQKGSKLARKWVLDEGRAKEITYSIRLRNRRFNDSLGGLY